MCYLGQPCPYLKVENQRNSLCFFNHSMEFFGDLWCNDGDAFDYMMV
jgi:hypothetical protein